MKTNAIFQSQRRSASDNFVWQRYIEEHLDWVATHRDLLLPDYARCLTLMNFSRDTLPTMEEVNQSLESTGWTVVGIGGYEASQTIFKYMANGFIPVAQTTRSLEHLSGAPQPDLLHDLVGHVPLAFNGPLMALSRAIARKGLQLPPSILDRRLYNTNLRLSTLKTLHDADAEEMSRTQAEVDELRAESILHPSTFSRLCRLYTWVAEFGLLKYNGVPRVIGGGLLSSHADLIKLKTGKIPMRPFDETVLSQEVSISGDQESVFVIESLEDVYKLMEGLG